MAAAGRDFFCTQCADFVVGGLRGFQVHLKDPTHVAPFVCGQDLCVLNYSSRKALYKHISNYHLIPPIRVVNECVDSASCGNQDFFNAGVDQENIATVDESDNDADQLMSIEESGELQDMTRQTELTDSAERVVLGLRSVTYMTGVAVQAATKHCFSLMQETAMHLQGKVQEFLAKPEKSAQDIQQLLEEFSLRDPFEHLKSKPQQMKCFQEKFGLLEAKTISLQPEFQARQNPQNLNLEPTLLHKSFQYVSIVDILKSVMSDTYLRNLILSEKASDDGYMRSFKDGALFASLPPDLTNAIRIILYIDDIELVQALSASAGKYKTTGIYFGIQNLPPELNSLLTYVFVTALAFAGDAKDSKVWEPFQADMHVLETEGVEIAIDGAVFIFKAVLIAQIGDTAAAHEVLGFRSPSSLVFCRVCYINRKEMWMDGTRVGERRNPERHADDVRAAAESRASQKVSGVQGPSKLDGFRFFHSATHSVFDIFHDLLQGICKMEVKLALREYVCVKKHFSEAELNARLKFFDYGHPDKKNKPSSIMKARYLSNISSYNLHLTGAQMWCLTRAFGFLFGDLVPPGDKFLKLISLLNQIMTIVFSRAISESDLIHLENLIEEHHQLFMEIFPNQPVPETQGDEDEILEAEDQEIFQDFYEDIDDVTAGIEEAVIEDQDNAQEADQPRQSSKKRKVRLINKHHHLLHYADQIRLFGPLILYWCIRYEARHFFFKLAATVCHNFKDVLKTLMDQLQMQIAAEKNKPRENLTIGKRGMKLNTVDESRNYNELSAFGLEPLCKVYEVQHVTYKGIDYRPSLFVTLQLQCAGRFPVFACIKSVYVNESKDTVYLVVEEWKTERFESLYCAFHVSQQSSTCVVKQPDELPAYRLLARWRRYDSDKIYLAPRTIA